MRVEPLIPRRGTYVVELPADKSLTHRALIFSACAKGSSTVINSSLARDCQTTVAVLRQLGVEIHTGEHLQIISPGRERWHSPRDPLDFGNSGTTARLLIGLLSTLPGITCVCCGDASLSVRPMDRVVRWLRDAGADIESKSVDDRLPLTIRGTRLRPFSCRLEIASAQIKSALLLAAMNTSGESRIDMPDGTRMHTEQMLSDQGIACTWSKSEGRQLITVRGPYNPRPQVWRIAADPSAAAFFVVLGVLLPETMEVVLRNVLDDDNRLAFLRIVAAMGGKVQRHSCGAGVCELTVRGGASLQAVQVAATEVVALIDEVPILAVLALFAEGETVWHGLGELRVKESDRLAAVLRLCQAAGRDSEVRGDTLRMRGSRVRIKSYRFDAQGDHRLSMAAAICAVFAPQPCVLENAAGVDISFPDFFVQLLAVTQGGQQCQST